MQKAAFPGRTQMKTGMEGTLNNEAEKRGYRKCCSTATAFGVPCGRAVGDSWSGRSIEIPEIRRAGNSLLCSNIGARLRINRNEGGPKGLVTLHPFSTDRGSKSTEG